MDDKKIEPVEHEKSVVEEVTIDGEESSLGDLFSMLVKDGWMSEDKDGNLAPMPEDVN